MQQIYEIVITNKLSGQLTTAWVINTHAGIEPLQVNETVPPSLAPSKVKGGEDGPLHHVPHHAVEGGVHGGQPEGVGEGAGVVVALQGPTDLKHASFDITNHTSLILTLQITHVRV